jgi:hypothetical protein
MKIRIKVGGRRGVSRLGAPEWAGGGALLAASG